MDKASLGKKTSKKAADKTTKRQWYFSKIGLAVIGLAIFTVGAVAFLTQGNKSAQPAMQGLIDCQIAYEKQHIKKIESWWLENPQSAGDSEITDVARKTDMETKKIENLLRSYRNASPLAEEMMSAILDNGFKPAVSIFQGGHSLTLSTNNPGKATTKSIEFCFIPQGDDKTVAGNLYYWADWSSLMIKALNWPEKIYAALLYHELGHYYRHKITVSSSATAEYLSTDWTREEVEMHELEAAVMNEASGGKFLRYIDSLTAKGKGATGLDKCLNNLKGKDFLALDKIMGCENCGLKIIGTLSAQYMFTVGFRYIENQMEASPAEKMRMKIGFYQWVVKTNS